VIGNWWISGQMRRNFCSSTAFSCRVRPQFSIHAAININGHWSANREFRFLHLLTRGSVPLLSRDRKGAFLTVTVLTLVGDAN
jgi:hypothetical protein